MSKRWYVVHTYSQFEKFVQRALPERIQRAGLEDQFGQILVPVEEVVELKLGQKNISERKFFPGYVLVEMEMTDESWHLVKSTPKVTGFLGGSAMKPTPISEKEVQNIMHQMQAGVENRDLRCYLKWARRCVLRMVHLLIFTAWWKMLIMIKINYAWR